jgi:hypothetical protein
MGNLIGKRKSKAKPHFHGNPFVTPSQTPSQTHRDISSVYDDSYDRKFMNARDVSPSERGTRLDRLHHTPSTPVPVPAPIQNMGISPPILHTTFRPVLYLDGHSTNPKFPKYVDRIATLIRFMFPQYPLRIMCNSLETVAYKRHFFDDIIFDTTRTYVINRHLNHSLENEIIFVVTVANSPNSLSGNLNKMRLASRTSPTYKVGLIAYGTGVNPMPLYYNGNEFCQCVYTETTDCIFELTTELFPNESIVSMPISSMTYVAANSQSQLGFVVSNMMGKQSPVNRVDVQGLKIRPPVVSQPSYLIPPTIPALRQANPVVVPQPDFKSIQSKPIIESSIDGVELPPPAYTVAPDEVSSQPPTYTDLYGSS